MATTTPLIGIIITAIKIYISQLKDPHKPLWILPFVTDWAKCLVKRGETKSVDFRSQYESLAEKKACRHRKLKSFHCSILVKPTIACQVELPAGSHTVAVQRTPHPTDTQQQCTSLLNFYQTLLTSKYHSTSAYYQRFPVTYGSREQIDFEVYGVQRVLICTMSFNELNKIVWYSSLIITKIIKGN